MYLNINPMLSYRNSISKKTFSKSNKPTTVENDNIAFKSMTLRKPVVADAEVQKINNKIISMFQKLPEFSATKKPLEIPFKNGIAGFIIDKSNNEMAKISIKVKENSNKIKNWDSISEFDKGMDIVLDKKGQMLEGVYYEAGGCHLLFRRLAKNNRRILYKHNLYMPDNMDKYSWKRITAGDNVFSTHERIQVDKDKFEVLFFEMAELDTSILAKK